MTTTCDDWHALVTRVNDVEAALGKVLQQEAGLAVSEFRALRFLAGAAQRELRMQDLAARLHMSQSSVSRMVERLDRAGYAKRDTCPDDKRGIYAVLTEAGEARLDALSATYEQAIARLIAEQGLEPLLRPGVPQRPSQPDASRASRSSK